MGIKIPKGVTNNVFQGVGEALGQEVFGIATDAVDSTMDGILNTVMETINDPTVENIVGMVPNPVAIGVGAGIDVVDSFADVPDWMAEDDVEDVTPPGVTPGVNEPSGPDPAGSGWDEALAGDPNFADPKPTPNFDAAMGGAVPSGCDCCDKCGPVVEPEFDPSKDCPDEKVILDTMNTFLGDVNKKGDELDKKLCQTKTEKKANDILFSTTLKKYEKRLANYIENCMNAPGKSEGGGCPKPTDATSGCGCGCGKPEGGCSCTKPASAVGGCGCKVAKQTPKKGPATCKKPAKPKKATTKPKKATTKPKKTSSVSTSCAKKRKDDSKWVPPKKKPKVVCDKPIPVPHAAYPPMAP